MLQKLISLVKRQTMPSVALLCALLSMFACPPSAKYAEYLDYDVLIMLFCLMAAIAGLRRCGLFSRMATGLVAGRHSLRRLAFILVMLPLFSAMAITNDVALITFTPLAILALTITGQKRHIPQIVVLQAIAANLGGMITPIGNPQNLFIFTRYHLTIWEFFLALAPFALAAIAMLAYECAQFERIPIEAKMEQDESPMPPAKLALHSILFAACLLAVVDIVPKPALLALTVIALAILDRKTLLKVDYGLLITFACFFIFSGNLASIPSVQSFLETLVSRHALLTSLFSSQIISNVPAAILLAPFTSNWHALLLGVDIGGLGTPIASLASLIALRLCLVVPGVNPKELMVRFLLLNAAFLVGMIAIYSLLFLIL